MRALRKLLSWLFWPLRMFGYAADAFQLWSLREWLLSVGGTAVITGLTWLVAFIAPLPRLPLYLVVGGSLLLAFWILTVIAENRRVRRITSATQSAARRDTTGTTIIEFIENANISVASATQPAQQETTAKRKAANDLLGNALEEGERLRQGRRYAIEGDENQNLGDIEIGNEHQARYVEQVRAWVGRTYDLIDDALGRLEAQRFISNEGYTDEEVLGRKLPSSLHVSSTRRKYSLRARLKRLHELIDRMHDLDINPDFDPDEWRDR